MTSRPTHTLSQARRRALRLGLRAAAVAAISCLAIVFAGPATASTTSGWVKRQLDSDWCWDAMTRVGDVWLDADNDCRWETHVWIWYSGGQAYSSMTFDTNGDGHWDVWYANNALRPGWTTMYTDTNGDGAADSSRQLPPMSSQASPQNDRAGEQAARDAVIQALARQQYMKLLSNITIVGRLG